MSTFFLILAFILLAMSLASLVRHDYWTFRAFEFPRVQKLVLSGLALAGLTLTANWNSPWVMVANIGLSINIVYLLWLILPFTRLGRRNMLPATLPLEPKRTLSFVAWNVWQENRNASAFLRLAEKISPDLLLLAETDTAWRDALQPLEASYPYRVQVPLDNTYGMLLYSRLELINPQVKYLVEAGVPSIHTQVKLPSGELLQFYGLHPTPPAPQENPRATERDMELMMVARLAQASPLPVVVAGDLNDVAWSYTTALFQRVSGLLDPRRGRGLFNTFHARYWLLRFPLDHVFCSPDFKLVRMRRFQNCGSDHFPIYIQLHYEPSARREQAPPPPTVEDEELAEEKIRQETRAEAPAG